jgi:hypothetical protein
MADHMNMEVKVLLPAGKIPVGATVTKKTGTKEYKLLDRLRVFPVALTKTERLAAQARNEKPVVQEIKAQPGVLFLVCDGNANAILATTELMWTTTAERLCYHLKHTLDPYRDCGK